MQPLQANQAVAFLERLGQSIVTGHLVPRGVQVTGVQAETYALIAAGGVEELRELLEGPAQRAARARGVLEMQLAAPGFGQRLLDHLSRALDRRADVSLFGRPGMQNHPGGT